MSVERPPAPGPSRPGLRGPDLSRRRLLAGFLLVPPALLAAPAVAGCSLGAAASDSPDPLVALADAARADAALAAAAIAADPGLAERVEPLRVARTEHAAALDAEVARLAPHRTPAPPPTPAPTGTPATLARVRAATQASAGTAAALVLTLPAERVGLVASVAACCGTYAAVLG